MTPLCEDPADPADPGMSSGRLNAMHQADTSGLFSGKGPPNFIDFQGEAQGEGQGSLRRPKEVHSYPKATPKHEFRLAGRQVWPRRAQLVSWPAASPVVQRFEVLIKQ